MLTDGWRCINCGKTVVVNDFIGTKNRNHCPHCLWSKHVDGKVAGDRAASCHGKMQPIGLTYKDEGDDKYGKPRQGELMLIHQCTTCGKISINRIAADDNADQLLPLLKQEVLSSTERQQIKATRIKFLDSADTEQVNILLFGKQN